MVRSTEKRFSSMFCTFPGKTGCGNQRTWGGGPGRLHRIPTGRSPRGCNHFPACRRRPKKRHRFHLVLVWNNRTSQRGGPIPQEHPGSPQSPKACPSAISFWALTENLQWAALHAQKWAGKKEQNARSDALFPRLWPAFYSGQPEFGQHRGLSQAIRGGCASEGDSEPSDHHSDAGAAAADFSEQVGQSRPLRLECGGDGFFCGGSFEVRHWNTAEVKVSL